MTVLWITVAVVIGSPAVFLLGVAALDAAKHRLKPWLGRRR